ncbi:PH domain-like protein [Parathielavia hyrcaniae]|uniref:PH domain-like protein n=1 Tax=Parathielavia hyrcaniae TaxID=113614 RepID=A0AAN6Q2Z8_9PEZI|nr:PH domain-like protein [Parathielavia hyrcaniae]
MTDDPHNTSDISDLAEPAATASEDAETTAARRELKQTTISEKAGRVPSSQDDKSASEDDAPKAAPPRITPPLSLEPGKEDVLKEQFSSPKKKRAHDELDENKDVVEAPLERVSGKGPSTATAQNRTVRSEPEKKRPRDRQASASAVQGAKEEVVRSPLTNCAIVTAGGNMEQEPLSASTSPRPSMEQQPPADTSKTEQPKQATGSAFASSGFAKLASSSTSPFGSFGESGKPSLFGSSSSASSSLGGVFGGPKPAAAPSAPPKLNFGGAAASSPFAGLNGQTGGSVFKSSPFASAFGGSALSGPRLKFGKPGEVLKSDKPARPFGAPDSDAEDKSGEESNDEEDTKGDASSNEDEGREDEGQKDDSKASEEKKRLRLQKIVVDDGEGQEVTIFSVRAKMYVMEKGAGEWKERGAGMLKVNVPRVTVDPDEATGLPDPASFDASVLGDEQDERRKLVRLIMRQDHTHRVILNTVVLPAMKLQVTNRLKTSTVLFTAFEEGEGRQVQMKLSEANATAFSQLVEMLKKRLADV